MSSYESLGHIHRNPQPLFHPGLGSALLGLERMILGALLKSWQPCDSTLASPLVRSPPPPHVLGSRVTVDRYHYLVQYHLAEPVDLPLP